MPNIQWLAGFFDAEGSVSFNYVPNIDIVNTSARTMFQIKDIMNRVGIEVGIHYREQPSKSSKKPRWDIFLRHEKQIMPFLEHVRPFVQGKRKQLEWVSQWYENKYDGLGKKIQFANQVNNIILLKPEHIMQKLGVDRLDFYEDIQILNINDNQIIPYPEFKDIDYLSGLIDGEGTININHRAAKHTKNKRYIPQILFNNTNKEIVKRYCSVLANHNMSYHITFREGTNRYRWDVMVSGIKRCEKMCSLITDHLETKKEQCNLLWQYCRHRLSMPKSYNDLGFETKTALQGMRKGIY